METNLPSLLLTDAFCKKALPHGLSVVEYADTKERGLVLRVTPAGARSWSLRYRTRAGEQKRISLGKLDDVTLADARKATVKQRAIVNEGGDPSELKKAKKAEAIAITKLETLAEVGERYFDEAVKGRHRPNGSPKKSTTIKSERYYFDRFLVPEFGKDKLALLTRGRIQAFIHSLEDESSKSSARQCRVILQGIFKYAAWQEIVDANPCEFVSAPTFNERDRVLTDIESAKIWTGLMHAVMLKDLHIGRPVCLALLICFVTAQRRGEVAGMMKFEIDFDEAIWTIPKDRTKNKIVHVVPLTPLATNLIKEAWRLSGDSPFLFPSRADDDVPIEGGVLSKAYRRLAAWLNLEDMRVHDLRRTAATNMAGIKVTRFIISRILNHKADNGGGAAVTAVYDRYAYLEEKRDGLDAWAKHLVKIVKREDRPQMGQRRVKAEA